MTAPADISHSQQLQAVNEVILQRQQGYPALVAKGKLRQSEADYRIAQMEAVADTLVRLIRDADAPKPSLDEMELAVFDRWMQHAAEGESTLQLKQTEADKGHDWVVASDVISLTDIVAVGRLLTALASLARLPGLGA